MLHADFLGRVVMHGRLPVTLQGRKWCQPNVAPPCVPLSRFISFLHYLLPELILYAFSPVGGLEQ